MPTTVIDFKSRFECAPMHHVLGGREFAGLQFQGVITITWGSSETKWFLDFYVDFGSLAPVWLPVMYAWETTSSVGRNYWQYGHNVGTIAPLYQPLYQFMKTYVDTHWWSIITRDPLTP